MCRIKQEVLSAARASIKSATAGPWVADIDDPAGAAEWTGKFYTNGGRDTWETYSGEHADDVGNARFVEMWNPAFAAAVLDELERLYSGD